jgi:glucokinase
MILAGDIGGTKTHLALFPWKQSRVEPYKHRTYVSADHKSFEELLAKFMNACSGDLGAEERARKDQPKIQAACFGIAGPVIDNQVKTTNLPWVVDGAELAKRFNIRTVLLLNDLAATAYGLFVLKPDETMVLNDGTPPREKRTIVLIAAGTGLGEAILYWDGTRYRLLPSEGGHAGFAPNTDLEIELLRYLHETYSHVSSERVLSGAGLYAIYRFLRDTKKNEPAWVADRIRDGNPPAVIAEIGLSGQAEICVQALDLFASIYGSEAGNLALKALALSGVYLAGGIAPKLVTKLQDGAFMRAFIHKGRYEQLMGKIPVRIILNQETALLGAASMAASLACES